MAKGKYSVKEIYYTLQGEGFHSGRPAVFCRLSGCNLWSGREEDRSTAKCQFCDTDFWGTDGENGGKYSASELTDKIQSLFPHSDDRFVVFTGGEPALQLDDILIGELKSRAFEIAIETNGTLELPEGIDWICMSPKANTDLVITKGNELKIIYPQEGINPQDFKDWDFDHFYIQAMDSPLLQYNLEQSIEFCKAHPQFKLSLQTHKLLNIP